MAKSKYEYVKNFEQSTPLLPSCYIVVRLDGRGFTKFCENHGFEKPNDMRGIELMKKTGLSVMENFVDMILSYGQSDEYTFIFQKNTSLFNRRGDKILSLVVSQFSSAYVFFWNEFFPDTKLVTIPQFDGRIILYPSLKELKAYMNWRQVDCHVNNLYNTTFWALVKKAEMSPTQAHEALKGTLSKDKNELLFSKFSINYNKEPEVFRRGTIAFRQVMQPQEEEKKEEVIFDQSEAITQKIESNPQ